MSALPARGELWWCELAEIGRRPVVVLSRDAAIQDGEVGTAGVCEQVHPVQTEVSTPT